MKELILAVSEAGLSKAVYDGFHFLNFIIAFIYAIWCGKKLKFGLKKTLLILFIAFPAIYLWMLILFWIQSGFQNFGGQNMVMVFVYVPIIALFVSKVVKVNWMEECYFHAASLPLLHGVGHLGCVFYGCCRGYEATWGLYNITTGKYHFPIQIIETIVSLTVAAILIVRSKKHNYVPDEKQFPLMLVMYGSTRFICEFFRDNTKILFGCSALSFHALFMCIVGIIWLVVIHNKDKKAY